MAFCTDCGTVSAEDAHFCSKCGKDFGGPPDSQPLSTLDLSTQRPVSSGRTIGYTSSHSSRMMVILAVAGFVTLVPIAFIMWGMKDGKQPFMPVMPPQMQGQMSEQMSEQMMERGPGSSPGQLPPGIGPASPEEARALLKKMGVPAGAIPSSDPKELMAQAQKMFKESDSDIARRGKHQMVARQLAVIFATEDTYPETLEGEFEEMLGFPLDKKVFKYEPTMNRSGFTLTVELAGEYPGDEQAIYLDGGYKLVTKMEGMEPVWVESQGAP